MHQIDLTTHTCRYQLTWLYGWWLRVSNFTYVMISLATMLLYQTSAIKSLYGNTLTRISIKRSRNFPRSKCWVSLVSESPRRLLASVFEPSPVYLIFVSHCLCDFVEFIFISEAGQVATMILAICLCFSLNFGTINNFFVRISP